MDVPNLADIPRFDEAKRSLARTLVRLVWDEEAIPQTFEFEY